MKTTLAAEAESAMAAFQLMQNTKQAHFELLEQLEERRKQGGSATISENLRLNELLEIHSRQVEKFRAEMVNLRDSDLTAYQSLIDHIKFIANGTEN